MKRGWKNSSRSTTRSSDTARRVEWLNYHHLLYFWTVVREGTVARAATRLRLSQPTISAQIHTLEDHLGEKLFEKKGRNLVLTEMGQVVFQYAEEIFALGHELMDAVKDRPTGKPLRLNVGIRDVVPKLIAYRLLAPALALGSPVRMVCEEDSQDALLQKLALHELDLVVSDAPVAPVTRIKAFNHALGETGLSFFAASSLAARVKRNFPASLHAAPILLPARETALRRALDTWLDEKNLRPLVLGEFDDSALAVEFGQAGVGVFCAPTVIEAEVVQRYGVEVLGRVDEVRERYYAITVERRLKHPAVLAISQAARKSLFA